MKSYSADAIRNVCVLAHGGVGKTTLAEAACFTAKSTAKLGKVEAGTSVFAARPDEKARKMSIVMAPGYCEWQDAKVNLLDAPGFLDLFGDTIAGLHVCESAVVLVDAVAGVQVGTEIAHRYAQQANVARFFFVNGMDKENADFDRALESIRAACGTSIAPLVMPIGASGSFKGVVDLIGREAFEYTPEGNGIGRKIEIPADMKDAVDAARTALMESVAESDEALMNAFFEKGVLTDAELRQGLATGVAQGLVSPLLSGSAALNIGIDQLLSKLVALAPAASSRTQVAGLDGDQVASLNCGESQPAVGYVFKTLSEEHLGEVSIVRLFSGKITAGYDLVNVGRGGAERVGTPFLMVGHERREVSELRAGDIGALLKLKATHTGDTLGDKSVKLRVKPAIFPEPLVSVAITPKVKGEDDKLAMGMAKIHEEDPTFRYGFQGDIHQTILSGMGDVHIDIILDTLKNRFKVEVEKKQPKISYRETITKTVKYVDYTHKKQTGGAGQFGRVAIDLEPGQRGAGYELSTKSLAALSTSHSAQVSTRACSPSLRKVSLRGIRSWM